MLSITRTKRGGKHVHDKRCGWRIQWSISVGNRVTFALNGMGKSTETYGQGNISHASDEKGQNLLLKEGESKERRCLQSSRREKKSCLFTTEREREKRRIRQIIWLFIMSRTNGWERWEEFRSCLESICRKWSASRGGGEQRERERKIQESIIIRKQCLSVCMCCCCR